jgi:hypothetical protein
MSTDRSHSRELVRQLRAKALQVKKERGQGEVVSGTSGTSRMEGRTTSASRSFAGSSTTQRKDTTAR